MPGPLLFRRMWWLVGVKPLLPPVRGKQSVLPGWRPAGTRESGLSRAGASRSRLPDRNMGRQGCSPIANHAAAAECAAMAAGMSSVKLPLTSGAKVGWRSGTTSGGGPNDGADNSRSSADRSTKAARSSDTAAAYRLPAALCLSRVVIGFSKVVLDASGEDKTSILSPPFRAQGVMLTRSQTHAARSALYSCMSA